MQRTCCICKRTIGLTSASQFAASQHYARTLSSVLSSCWMELVGVSNHSDNYYLAIATTATLLVLFIKAAVVFAVAALIGKLFGIW